MAQNVGVKPNKKMKPFHWNKLRGISLTTTSSSSTTLTRS
jgi:hypothetical protein